MTKRMIVAITEGLLVRCKCGGKANMYREEGKLVSWFYVQCLICHARSEKFLSEEGATFDWNSEDTE